MFARFQEVVMVVVPLSISLLLHKNNFWGDFSTYSTSFLTLQVVYKLTDFGYAKTYDQSSVCESLVGTVQYVVSERVSE